MPVAASSDPVPLDPPARRTNIMDQLAVPIDSINLPEMPIGEFVGFMSGMAAVPIELDAKVLGEVGLSTRSTVTVHSDDTTVGKLLARVLKEHQLTCTIATARSSSSVRSGSDVESRSIAGSPQPTASPCCPQLRVATAPSPGAEQPAGPTCREPQRSSCPVPAPRGRCRST